MRGVLLAVLLLALPGSLWAQAGLSPNREGNRVKSAAAVLLKGSSIADKGRLQAGGWAGLVFGDRLAVGGGGLVLLEEVALSGSEAGTGFSLDLDYGGLFFRFWQPLSPRTTGELGLVFGAGNAGVKDRLSGTELGSDNFLVTEPEAGVSLNLLPWLRVGISGGYRLVWGIEDLPSVSDSDLRALTGTISLRVGGK
jgi:hypothetical protein